MVETVVSPEICTFSDESLESLNIQVELSGVDKEDIELNFFEDGFYIVAKKKIQSTWVHILLSLPCNLKKQLQSTKMDCLRSMFHIKNQSKKELKSKLNNV